MKLELDVILLEQQLKKQLNNQSENNYVLLGYGIVISMIVLSVACMIFP